MFHCDSVFSSGFNRCKPFLLSFLAVCLLREFIVSFFNFPTFNLLGDTPALWYVLVCRITLIFGYLYNQSAPLCLLLGFSMSTGILTAPGISCASLIPSFHSFAIPFQSRRLFRVSFPTLVFRSHKMIVISYHLHKTWLC